MYENYEWNASKQIWFVSETFYCWPNDLFRTNLQKTFKLRWYWLLAYYRELILLQKF